jgi:hypothetical protein
LGDTSDITKPVHVQYKYLFRKQWALCKYFIISNYMDPYSFYSLHFIQCEYLVR